MYDCTIYVDMWLAVFFMLLLKLPATPDVCLYKRWVPCCTLWYICKRRCRIRIRLVRIRSERIWIQASRKLCQQFVNCLQFIDLSFTFVNNERTNFLKSFLWIKLQEPKWMRIRTETLLEIVAFTIQTFLKLSANILILTKI